MGYTRFDAQAVVGALNALYEVLTPFLNHFVASRRIVAKERVGARWVIKRERVALTPYQRVLARPDVAQEVKAALRATHEGLNLFVLKQAIDRRLKIVFTLQERYGRPKRN